MYFEEACQVLEISYQKIPFVYAHIGERFRTANNTCEVNEDWVIETLRTNFLYDLQYQMYYEARHLYQTMVIADYRARGKSKYSSIGNGKYQLYS